MTQHRTAPNPQAKTGPTANTDPETDPVRFILRHTTRLATELGVAAETARNLAQKLAASIRGQFGGSRVYVRAPSKEFRNQDILRDWDIGMSKGEIAAKYGIHLATVSRILGNHRLPAKTPSQGDGLAPKGWGL